MQRGPSPYIMATGECGFRVGESSASWLLPSTGVLGPLKVKAESNFFSPSSIPKRSVQHCKKSSLEVTLRRQYLRGSPWGRLTSGRG